MHTLNEIKNKKFDKAAFGYKVEDVENFLNEVIDYVSALENEKVETEKKLVVLANKIEEYRNEEDSLRQALLGAQKLGDSILKEAKNRAEIIMRDATIKSENIVKNVKEEVKREEVILNKMKREVDAFRTKMLTMYNSHIDMIKSIPEVEREKAEEVAEPEVKAEVKVVEPEVKEEPAIEIEAAPEPEVKEEIVVETLTPPEEEQVAPEIEEHGEQEPEEEGFKISGGFKFSRFDEKEDKKESKFGPLKFGDGYDLDDEGKR
ncbi:MAG: DivIVA domain-containing protein [Oscillospiraceae bacterium]|nr:DivIVA domain-containing protein [Oscillospiraceae bacterium]